ncbi:hypothetical protein ACFPM0_07150 [Pseudonocardia sulfidoxydans]
MRRPFRAGFDVRPAGVAPARPLTGSTDGCGACGAPPRSRRLT